jgi:thiamine biosynthesis lipoprotein
MGTAVSVHLADLLPGPVLRRLADEVCAWLHLVDERFSTYREESEISRLGRGTLALDDCSADVRAVLEECAELWRSTDGYFDVYAPGRLDPSGYVKGWAVQVASDRLLAEGVANHSLNAGGDVRVRGGPAPGERWRIGIRHPWQADRVSQVVTGSDLAVATSGTYERGFHVINPRLGTPARGLVSVTVVGQDLGLADAYATAAVAMGEAGLDWLARLDGYECAAITEDGRSFRSAGFPVAENVAGDVAGDAGGVAGD